MAYYTFPSAITIRVHGPDTERYLNNRLTNAIKTLQVGSGCLAAALSPQGKTEGFFSVYRLEENDFLLVSTGGDPVEVLSALSRFKVADRVEFDVEDLMLVHTDTSPTPFQDLNSKLDTDFSIVESNGSFLARNSRIDDSGMDLIIPAGKADEYIPELGIALDYKAWNIRRVKYGTLSFPEELSPGRLFSEANLKSAISFTKGCYVGQEVVEKVDAYGKAPRIICALSIPGADPEEIIGAKVQVNEDENIGSILSAFSDAEEASSYCFARLKNDEELLKKSIFVSGHPAKLLET